MLFKASATLGGADLSKIQTVSFAAGGPPLLDALKNHQIDGFASWEPNNAGAAVAGDGYYSSLDLSDNPTRNVNGLLTVNSAFLQAHRAAVLGVVRALGRRDRRSQSGSQQIHRSCDERYRLAA